MKSEQFLVVIFSLVFGGILGEWWNWEEKLNRLGQWLEAKVSGNGQGSIAKGFVSATLLFVIGAMAIVGALDSGLRGDHSVLYTKSILDGFASVILTTTLGIGVIFSALPVVVYEGSIALLATQIERFVPKEVLDSFIAESTATGGSFNYGHWTQYARFDEHSRGQFAAEHSHYGSRRFHSFTRLTTGCFGRTEKKSPP